ncbi:aspartic proteinase NANA, chloroplast [Impatiens glandulifera]|uniref:aspartic proteinase NANA, chloroplast n=1 Tax=Impatiens glandulifera TaxID=253017 RepID=UPI001FB12D7E|nr:aspartic proteinase NANA, chloroplast [Impatiens glandulifera]
MKMVHLFYLSSFFILLIFNFSGAGAGGATVPPDQCLKLRLLRRENSPSLSDTLFSDLLRLSKLNHPRNPQLPLTSGASAGVGQYFVDLHVGSPPQRLLLVADTGSDLVWVRCSACRNCSARPSGSAFLARHSESFKLHHCYDKECQLAPRPIDAVCNHTRLHSPCQFDYSYVDGSRTSGLFSSEEMTFNTTSGRLTKHDGLSFGCAFQVAGPSLTGRSFNGANGVMGLGRGPISFVSQLGKNFGHKFSYCLMDYTLSPPPTSFLQIGGSLNNTVEQSRINYTPLLVNVLSPTFYYIGIQSVTVGGTRLQINPSIWSIDESGNGGTVVDSGTTLTFLAEPGYRQILAAFRRRIKFPSPAELTPGFDLCINISGVSKPSLPRLSFKLGGGSVLSPPPRNYFIDTADGVKCLALQPVNSPTGLSVIGNLMQQGFLFEFDKDRSQLGFTRHSCSL